MSLVRCGATNFANSNQDAIDHNTSSRGYSHTKVKLLKILDTKTDPMDALYQLSYYEQKGKKRNTPFAELFCDMLVMEGGAPANVAGGAPNHTVETAQKTLRFPIIKYVDPDVIELLPAKGLRNPKVPHDMPDLEQDFLLPAFLSPDQIPNASMVLRPWPLPALFPIPISSPLPADARWLSGHCGPGPSVTWGGGVRGDEGEGMSGGWRDLVPGRRCPGGPAHES
jgi:hypothetical protein